MRVKAINPVTYNARDYRPGDEFDTVEDIHGTILIQNRSVVAAPPPAPPRAMKAEENNHPVIPTETAPARRRGDYRRRDMRADE